MSVTLRKPLIRRFSANTDESREAYAEYFGGLSAKFKGTTFRFKTIYDGTRRMMVLVATLYRVTRVA